MKKRYIIIPVLIALVLFLTWQSGSYSGPIPKHPDVATELGHYALDNHRAVEIRKQDGELQYCEVTADGGFTPKDGSGIVAYAINVVDDIKLSDGWSLSLEGSSTIVINTGGGEIIRREFGATPVVAKVLRSEVTRKQMEDGFNQIIAGDPMAVPIGEVEASRSGESDDLDIQIGKEVPKEEAERLRKAIREGYEQRQMENKEKDHEE